MYDNACPELVKYSSYVPFVLRDAVARFVKPPTVPHVCAEVHASALMIIRS